MKRQTRAFTTGANVGKGKVKQTRANEERSRARSHRQSPHPELRTSRSPAIDEKISLDASEVSAWANTVAAAEPPEKVDHIVFWSDDEDVRAPVRDWDNWRVSYKQPSRSSFAVPIGSCIYTRSHYGCLLRIKNSDSVMMPLFQ